jgi:hypothetical protein
VGEAGLTKALVNATAWVGQMTGRLKRWADTGDNVRRVLEVLRRALQGLGVGLAILTTGKVLDWFLKLRAYINAVGVAGMWANVKLLLVPAAVLAILLAIEDLWGFTQGKDSLFGRLLGKAGIDPEPIRAALRKVGKAFLKLWAAVKEGGATIAKAFAIDSVDELITALAGLVVAAAETTTSLIDGFRRAGETIGEQAAKVALAWEESWSESDELASRRTYSTWGGVWVWMREGISETLTSWVLALDETLLAWGDAIRAWWDEVAPSFEEAGETLAAVLGLMLTGPFALALIPMYLFWDETKAAAGDAASWLASLFGDLWDGIAGAFWVVVGGIGDAFLWSFQFAIDAVLAVVEAAVNAVAATLNVLPNDLLDEMGIREFANNGVDLSRPEGRRPPSMAERAMARVEETRPQREKEKADAKKAADLEAAREASEAAARARQEEARLSMDRAREAAAGGGFARSVGSTKVKRPGGGEGYQTLGGVAPPPPGAATASTTNVTLGQVTIQVQGSMDMTNPQFKAAVEDGAKAALAKAVAETYQDAAQVW